MRTLNMLMVGGGVVRQADNLWLSKLSHHLLAIIGLTIYGLVPMVFCLACVQPALPDFWSSLLPSVTSLSIPARLAMATLQAYLLLIMCDVGVVAIYSGFPFNFGSLSTLTVMR